MYVYQCEDTLESVFTAIYRVYEEHRPQDEVLLTLDDEPHLFAEHIKVEKDPERSEKVASTLCKRFGMEDYERICLALTTPDMEKAQAVYRTIASGLALQKGCAYGRLFENLGDAMVCRALKLARNAERECGHLKGFLRFAELDKGALYAQVKPKNNLLPFLMAHFADRFPEENFMICDEGRKIAGVHYKQGGTEEWILFDGRMDMPEQFAEEEKYYQNLFRRFCVDIGIRERANIALQRSLLPLHFRKYMTEF